MMEPKGKPIDLYIIRPGLLADMVLKLDQNRSKTQGARMPGGS